MARLGVATFLEVPSVLVVLSGNQGETSHFEGCPSTQILLVASHALEIEAHVKCNSIHVGP